MDLKASEPGHHKGQDKKPGIVNERGKQKFSPNVHVHIHNTFSLRRGHVLRFGKEPACPYIDTKGLYSFYSSIACNLIG